MTPSPNKKFRVLIVDDSAFMRKVLETIFNADDQLQVIGQAKDGREAVALAESLKPDVITMDIKHAARGWFAGNGADHDHESTANRNRELRIARKARQAR